MSLSWKVLPSWLLQLKGLRLKDDRIYTAQDKHFSSDISCRNYKLCTAVLYFLDQKSPQLPHAPPCSLPQPAQLPGLKPRPSTPAPGPQGCDSRAGCFTAQEEAHGRSEHLVNPNQARVGFTTLGKQKSWKHSTAAIKPETSKRWSWGSLLLHFCRKTWTRLGEIEEKQGRWRLHVGAPYKTWLFL